MQNQNEPFLATTEEGGQPGMPCNTSRKPMFTDEAKREAIRAWEQRDTLAPGMKLDEFLERKFGVTPDGAPLVPTQTFFGWRKKFMRSQVKQS
jgi:hypothetical protein